MSKLIFHLFTLYFQIKKQKKFVQLHLQSLVDEVKSTSDDSLSSNDYYKVSHYYGLGSPVLVGESLAKLRGLSLNTTEKKALTFMAALTGLFDDFFDKTNHSKEQIVEMMSSPYSYQPNNSREKLFILLTTNALENIKNKQLLEKVKLKVMESQWASKQQKSFNLSQQELYDISANKGGAALLFYCAALENSFSQTQEQTLFKVGAWLQFANDIFDVYKDLQEGVHTFITESKNINEVIFKFKQDTLLLYSCCLQMEESKRGNQFLIDRLKIVESQVQLCLKQYKKVQEKHSGTFTPKQYSRNELICDMQKPINFLKTIYYYTKN